MKTLIRKGLLLLSCIIILLMPLKLASAHSLAGGKGHISGHLLNGTQHNAPVANQSVTLQIAQSQAAQDLGSVTTDAKGAFSFDDLSTDKTVNYAIYTSYQGAQYVTDLISLTSNPVQQVDLTVYESTTSSAEIAVVRSQVLIHEPDTQQGTITVSEAFFFQNLTLRSYVGSLDASNGKPNALRFSLPQGARSVTLGTGFDGYKSVQVDRGFATDAAVPPGESQFAFSFEIAYSGTSYSFDYEAIYPTVQLSVLVPPDVHAASSTLTSQGPMTVDQHTYLAFNANQLLATHTVQLGLDGLPLPNKAGPPSLFDSLNLWLIGGILLMLVIVASTWLYYRSVRRRAAATRRKRGRQLKGAKAAKGAKNVPVSSRVRKTEPKADTQQALLQELLELDKTFEAGKLAKNVYRERRAKLKARLRSVMGEEEAARR